MKNIQLSIVFLSFIFLGCVASFSLSSCNDLPKVKPNIVFILLDDLGWKDVGFMESSYYETPNIDALAGQGMIFTNAYSNAANCAPTRASLLSGQYTPRHGVFTVGKSTRGESKDRRLVPTENSKTLPLDKTTIAEALKPVGYVSAALGKWNVGNSPAAQGFDIGIDKPDLGFRKGFFSKENEYLTDKLTDEAIDFITDNNQKPFFLYLAHHAVHTPIQAKKNLIAKYKNKAKESCHNDPVYAAMIESVDQSVGKINKTLENLGLSDNTILIFFSDNGGHGTYTCQKPLRGGKGMFYEGGIRVPMFAYWPNRIKAGSFCEQAVIGTDFYPTFLDLASCDYPENYNLDGHSLVPLLEGNKSKKEDALYWHFPAYLQSYAGLRNESRDTTFRARPISVIRKGDWKLLMYHEEWVLDGGRKEMETNNAVAVYNLKNDIGEQYDLSKAEHEKRDELLDQLIAWPTEVNAPIPKVANQEFITNSK